MTRSLGWIVALVLTATTVGTQRELPRPSVFQLLEGSWEGEGTLFDQPARFRMVWRLVGPDTATLHFENGLVDGSGTYTTVLTADAEFVAAERGVVASWRDSRGESIRIEGEATDSTLVSNWASSSESGRTEYSIRPGGSVVVRDWVQSGGALRLFGVGRYRRSTPSR